MSRDRLRNLGITIGHMPTGVSNAITDVPGVWVGQETVIADKPRTARTGVTVILPHSGIVWQEPVFAGFHSFNGSGEMTGLLGLEEGGVLNSPTAHAIPLEELQNLADYSYTLR
jgi:D-aminopeptidase